MRIALYIVFIIFFTGCMPSTQPTKQVKKEIKNDIQIITHQAPQIIEEQITIDEDVIEEEVLDPEYKVALVYPSKIMSKYGVSAAKAVNAYLLQQNIDSNVEVFDCIDQSYENLVITFNQLNELGYKKVVALMTANMVTQLPMIPSISSFDIYVPTVNKNEMSIEVDNVIYGGIDYEKQIDTLIGLAKGKIVNFYTKRGISEKLTNMLNQKYPNVQNVVIETDTDYTDLFKRNDFKYKTIFLNTTLIKSSIVLSQIRANEVEPYVILTTQLNYNPHLISMTQYEDRKNLYYANSIGKSDELLEENSDLLGADLVYDWVNYSTLVGVDYFLKENSYAQSLIQYEIKENQVEYPMNIVKNSNFGFTPYLSANK